MIQQDDSNRGPQVDVVFSIFLVITTVATALRVYVRGYLIKNFGPDDWTAVIGWFFFVLNTALYLIAVAHGAGQHTRFVEPQENVSNAMMWIWLSDHAYILSIMAVKMSIGLMLLRFLQERYERLAIWTLIGIFEVYSALFLMIITFTCTLVSFVWTRYRGATHGRCINFTVLIVGTYIQSGLNCIMDWTFAIIPWFILRNLQLNRRTKVLTSLALSLGALASIATIIRLPYIVALNKHLDDFLYRSAGTSLWCVTEVALSIVASAATTFKPLFKRYLSRSGREPIRPTTLNQPRKRPTKSFFTSQSISLSTVAGSDDDHRRDTEPQHEMSTASTTVQEMHSQP